MTFLSKEFADACASADAAASVDRSSSRKPWSEGLITAAALQSKQFKPVRIILPGLIPEGATLLAGKPKVGKSWLALDVCLAVADESRFVLGDTRPVHGNALYLALEDNERRLHWRIKKIVQGQPQWPDWLDLRTEWRRVDEGGLDDMEAWCEAVERPRLIWIDTLPKIRPLGLKGREQAYAADYRAMEGLQALAGRRQLGIVVNAHLRKAVSEDDPIDDINGTLGLTGAADTAIVLKRQSGMVKVYVRGRDIGEAELAAEFNRETCRWRIVGGAEEAFRSHERQAIIAALKDAGADKDGEPIALPLDDILTATERRDRGPLKSLLHKMRKANEVVSPRVGYYALPSNPLNSVDRLDRAISEGVDNDQVVETTAVSGGGSGQRPGQRPVNGTVSVDRALTDPEQTNPLGGNEDCSPGQRVNAVNGIERGEGQLCRSTSMDVYQADRASMDPEGIYGGKGDAGLPPKAHLREPGQRVSAVNGIEHTAPDDGLTLPPDLDRTKGNGPHTWRAVRRCDHCGQPATPANALKPYDWPGRPDGIRLHRRCEEPWHDAHHPRENRPATAHNPISQRPS